MYEEAEEIKLILTIKGLVSWTEEDIFKLQSEIKILEFLKCW